MKPPLLIPVTLILIFCILPASPARILFILPVSSMSHVHVFIPLMKALSERNHEIVAITSHKSADLPTANVRQIVPVPVQEIFKKMQNPFELRQQGKLTQIMNVSLDHMTENCEKALDHKDVQEILQNEKGKFDVILVDILLNYCVLGMLPVLKSPYIMVSTAVTPSFIREPLGGRLPPSFVPSTFFGDFGHRMTFLQRVTNFFFIQLFDFIGHAMFFPQLDKVYQQKLGISESSYEILQNSSMILANTHFTLTYPQPYMPDVVDVGGMHTRPAKELPKDLEDFISGAEHGCILFSLGSIAQGTDMPEKYRKVFVNVFAKLKQRVIWKWESDSMPDQPKNVKVSKWLPQQDVLGHPNVKLFMTHGGLLSIQETIFQGVPVLVIPLFADQDLNAKRAEKTGIGLSIEIMDMTEQSLESKITEVLENKKYTERVKELSNIWQDQPVKPLDAAVFWTEYVIRHKGARHLRSASRDLNFFQYHSLDVILFLLAVLFLILYAFYIMLRKCCAKVYGKGSKKDEFKSTKKLN